MGPWGKVDLCYELGIGQLIDDDDDILWDAKKKKLRYFAIKTKRNQHLWCDEAYWDLPDAVEALLSLHYYREGRS